MGSLVNWFIERMNSIHALRLSEEREGSKSNISCIAF